MVRVESVHPTYTHEAMSSWVALEAKFVAKESVQPGTASMQMPSWFADGSKLDARESVQPRYEHVPSSMVAARR